MVSAELVTVIQWIKQNENKIEYWYQDLVDVVFSEKGKL